MADAPFVSYAQHGEDVVLWRALGGRDGVTYVDVGAFHPSDDSVTRALYERGWRGVNIEAQPDRLAAFDEQRPQDTNLALAVGDTDGTITLTLPGNPGWASTLPADATGADPASATLEVPVRRLDTLLPELGIEHVDVLKVDVEGAEPAVVRGLLGGPVRPVVCVVEGEAPGLGRAAGDEAVRLLVEAGYTHCMFDGLNHYLTTDPALVGALSVPANPVDGYVTDLVHRLMRERATLHESVATLATENLRLRHAAPEVAAPAPAAPPALLPGPGAQPALDDDVPTSALDTAVLQVIPLPEASSDLPVPVAEDAEDGAVPAWPDLPLPSLVDLDTRRERRRELFRRLLRGRHQPPPVEVPSPLSRLLRLIDEPGEPGEAVAVLYHEVLGRAPDPEGAATWVAMLERGEELLSVARELARTPEARAVAPEHRERVEADLAAWASLVTARELGLAGWQPLDGHTPGRAGEEIFVRSLFEVALQREPSEPELRHELAKLASGVGREWLLRAYAARPEVHERFLGTPAGGLRGRLRQARDRRHLLLHFRSLVRLAEARRLAVVLGELHAARGRLTGAGPTGPAAGPFPVPDAPEVR